MVIDRKVLYLLLSLFLLLSVFAHEAKEPLDGSPLEDHGVQLKQRSLWVILGSSVFVGFVVLFSLGYDHHLKHKTKWVLFLLITVPIVAATLYAAGTTIYLNLRSATAGPVHWHADFEVWHCGEKVDLKDPSGFSNRIGSPIFHEHGDNRIHVEGVVLEYDDVTLHHFFQYVGGEITDSLFVVPTNDGFVTVKSSDTCNGQPAVLQAFLYSVRNPEEKINWEYQQVKLKDISNYVLAPHSQVPPGDCLIIEFDPEKEFTDKICATYTSAIQRGELHGR